MTASGTALPVDVDRTALRVDPKGVLRVGKSRISLDLVVRQYENGMTPQEMVRAYESLVLPDVYTAVAYYLRHRDGERKGVRSLFGNLSVVRKMSQVVLGMKASAYSAHIAPSIKKAPDPFCRECRYGVADHG